MSRHPIWAYGRVPNGYWSIRANRVRYMQWLGRRLGYRKTTDWYGLTRQKFLDHDGGGLLATVYKHSPLAALRDFKPDYDWKPWLLSSTPQSYWRKKANRIAFMRYLGEQLGFETNEDWYELTQQDFRDHGGNGLLAIHYQNSPLRALKEFKPRVKWREWEFAATPQRYWYDRENRRRYMHWLGKRLGLKRPEDWYTLSRRDFHDNCGSAFLRSCPRTSPIAAVKEYWPNHPWKEWLFPRVPNGFWKRRANRQRYLRWLGEELGFTRPGHWYALTRDEIRTTGGGTLLTSYYNNSLIKLLRDLMPEYQWDEATLYRGGADKRLPDPAPRRRRGRGRSNAKAKSTARRGSSSPTPNGRPHKAASRPRPRRPRATRARRSTRATRSR